MRWASESGSLALFECADDVVLARGAEPDERFVVGLAAIIVELREPTPVEVLQVLIGASEREIDVVEHTRIERARLARRARHQPFGEGCDRGGVLGIEESAISAGGMRVPGRGNAGCCVFGVRLCQRFRHGADTCAGDRRHCRTQ